MNNIARVTTLTLMGFLVALFLMIMLNGLPHDPMQWAVFAALVVGGPVWVYVHNNRRLDELTCLKSDISENLRRLRVINTERAECLGRAYKALDALHTYDIRRYAWLNDVIKDELIEDIVSVSRVA